MADSQLPAIRRVIEQHKDEILSRLPKLNEWLTPEIWYSIVTQIEGGRLEEVAEKNPRSLVQALCKLADWGLKPDNEEAFINVYNTKQIVDGKDVWLPTAEAQWMWKGGIRRAIEAGAIAHAAPEIIREGDEIEEFIDEKGRHLRHKRPFGKLNRKIIGSYCLFWLPNRLMDYELCDLEDIENAKAASLRNQRSQNPKLSPAWEYGYKEMARKTAVRRGLKRMQGNRDKSFAAMVANETQFDAETIGNEVDPGELSEDEIPRAEAKVEVVPDADTVDERAAALVAAIDAAIPTEITDAERQVVATQYKEWLTPSKGKKARQLLVAIQKAVPGFTSWSDLKTQADVVAAMNAMRDA